MINVKRLARPNKRSGHELKPGGTTTVKGIVLTNKNKFCVYVDRYTRKK